jgi:protein-S-isoprenylcysteine O-methyltransferase Ste14
MDTTKEEESKKLSLLDRFKNLLGAGLYLLVIGLLLEALTFIIQQWLSFPFSLTVEIQVALTILCMLCCMSGVAWFNSALNLIQIHLLNGENKLITNGPFNYVRHPLYATLLLTLPPLMIIWYTDFLFLLPWVSIYIVAHYVVLVEEKGLLKTFGEDYKLYQKYVPALIPYKGAGGERYRTFHDSTASNDDEIAPA